jgi:hypothetical protein
MEQSITVKVKLASRDEAFEIAAEKGHTVQQLKQQIAAAANIQADKQRCASLSGLNGVLSYGALLWPCSCRRLLGLD